MQNIVHRATRSYLVHGNRQHYRDTLGVIAIPLKMGYKWNDLGMTCFKHYTPKP